MVQRGFDRVDHLEAVAAAGAAILQDQSLQQRLIARDGIVSNLDGDDIPVGALNPLMYVALAKVQALKDALEPGHLAGVQGVNEGVLDPFAVDLKRLAVEPLDVPLPSEQVQQVLVAGERVDHA
ncbi:hypothetical protein D3C85_1253430 [compost metagenome]